MDPEKLKVVDLRKELQQRGLDTKGNKAVLVKRLRDALDAESGKGTKGAAPNTDQEPSVPASTDEQGEELEKPIPVKEDVKSPQKELTKLPSPQKELIPQTPKQVVKEELTEVEQSTKESPKLSPVKNEDPEPKHEANGEKVETQKVKQNEMMETETRGEKRKRDDEDDGESENKEKKRREDSIDEVQAKTDTKSPSKTPVKKDKIPLEEDEPEIDYEKPQLSWFDSDLHLKIDKKTFLSAEPLNEGCFGYVWAGARATHGISRGKICFEVKIKEALKWEDLSEKMQEKTDKVLKEKYRIDRRKEKGSDNSNDKKEQDKKTSETTEGNNKNVEEHSDTVENTAESKDLDNEGKSVEETATDNTKPKTEETVEDKNEATDNTKPQTEETVEDKNEAKVDDCSANTVKDVENKSENNSEQAEKEEKNQLPPILTHYFRIGFSMLGTSLQLGETKYSYAYESTGKFVTNNEFRDYGATYGAGDVIGAYLNIDDNNVSITYTVNGALQPLAITVPCSEFPENFSLFPHVLCRNYSFELNFGAQENPWFPNPEELKDYEFLHKVKSKVEGPRRPEKREECEVLLMIGLPGSGKTHWVKNHVANITDKQYTVIGNHPLFDRMTVEGQPMKSRFKGSWKILVDRMQKCLNQLTDRASLRRRNYIIDQTGTVQDISWVSLGRVFDILRSQAFRRQLHPVLIRGHYRELEKTNVFPNAQRRKLRGFEGFKRKAVIVVCEDDEHARRQKDQQNDYGKTVPESTMYDLKAQMELPQKCEWIEELVFADLNEEEARKKVKTYNEEANKKGYVKRWQARSNDKRNLQRNFRGGRRGGTFGGNRYPQGPSWNRPSSGWRGGKDMRAPPPARSGPAHAWPSRHATRGSSRPLEQTRPRGGRGTGGYSSGRGQGNRNANSWQSGSGGGSNWGSGNSRSGWNAAVFGTQGYGAWNQGGQTQGQQSWKFGGNQSGYNSAQGQRGYGGSQRSYGSGQGGYGGNQGGYSSQVSYGNNQGYNTGSQGGYGNQGGYNNEGGYGNQSGYGQQGWNYYGQYNQQQGWGSQQGHAKGKSGGNSANHSQQQWTQHAQQYSPQQWSQARRH